MNIIHAEINLESLKHNFNQIAQKAPNSKIVGVVKANGYGHGAVKIAKALPDAYAFAVARINEALELRKNGIEKEILLLEGFFEGSDLTVIAEQRFQTVVQSQEQIDAILNADLKSPITVWLKLDTGMHRIGFHPDQLDLAYEQLLQSKNVKKPINMVTHFNRADEPNNTQTLKQIKVFEENKKEGMGLFSLASSPGILAWENSHQDVVRPGIALHGISPFEDSCGSDLGLKPVMTLKSKLIAVRSHKAGEEVGYGGIWTASSDTNLGVVAIGYGDGYPRTAPLGTPMLINGRIVPIVGRVAMDMVTVDLGAKCLDKAGDQVIIWGEGLPVETVSKHIGTIPYELVTKLMPRVELKYIEEPIEA